MLKKFFDTTAVDAFAAWVVDELKRLRPPGSLESESKAAVKQRNRFDAGLLSKIDSTAIGSHLNFYQKAILGSRLEERLEAAGYPRAFGRVLSREVVRMVAMSSALRS